LVATLSRSAFLITGFSLASADPSDILHGGCLNWPEAHAAYLGIESRLLRAFSFSPESLEPILDEDVGQAIKAE
jgi:hypothetical protein